MPKRIQLSRAKGYRKPQGAIVVSRPSKWGNPYRVRSYTPWPNQTYIATAETAVELFKRHVLSDPEFLASVELELRGHDLACWCRPTEPCHADVLLDLANRTSDSESKE